MSRVKEVRVMIGNKRSHSAPKHKRRPVIPKYGEDESELIPPNTLEIEEDDKMYRDPNGPYTNAKCSRILLYIMFIWCVVLSVLCIVLFGRTSGSVSAPLALPAPIFEKQKDQSKWHVPFNLVPDENSNGRIMTLKVSQMNYRKLLKYDICCKKGPIYACRAVSKNVGVEGYFTSEGKAIIHINHPDMIGSQCTLMWIEIRDLE
jgi:hypothetical protein